jgi:aminopeptidase
MINQYYQKLAKLIVNYSVEIKKGERVYLFSPALAQELVQALYMEILKAGGHPYLTIRLDGIREIFFKYASEDQLLYQDKIEKTIIEEFDVYIWIDADYNRKKFSNVDPKLLVKYFNSPARKEMNKIFEERADKGELRYLGCPFPCNALAQEANMDLASFTELWIKALYLDKEEPVLEWQKMEKEQDRLIEYLNQIEKIHVIGEDTELKFSIKGRKWINYCGKLNLPDGEVCTAPIEDSVNGHIRFTYPGIYMGKEIENIYLEFKDGKVVNATADKGQEFLNEILKIENANILGEFAIGTNDGISKFTKNMFFDEKMGSILHCALGDGYKKSGSRNESSIHRDILKDMKISGSKIIADGKLIYEEGTWKI